MGMIFKLGNALAVPPWLLMILAPDWRGTRRIVSSPMVVAPHSALYAILLAPQIRGALPALARPTVPRVAALLGTPEGATAAWLHFTAADLFVGRWIYLDARERGLPARLVSPVLSLTLVFSPAGLLAYLVLRAAARPLPGGRPDRSAA